MLRKIAIAIVGVLIVAGLTAYHLYSRGTIEPDGVYIPVIGLQKSEVFSQLGRPRRFDEWTEHIDRAFWQGWEDGGWVYEVFFVDGLASHVTISNHVFYPDVERLKAAYGKGQAWYVGTIVDDVEQEAWLTEGRQMTIYDHGLSIHIADDRSFLWK